MFPWEIDKIKNRIQEVDPVKYGRTRNFEQGALTYLSPYISRGVITTKQVFEHIQSLPLEWQQIEKLVQELAWRDYWQQIWIEKGDAINNDLKHSQSKVANNEIAQSIVRANTEITAVDAGINSLYETGYMHNHMRMYTASIACNIAQSHWRNPAQWMHYHLLDGDWASNALSWQWVAGSNANKKYYANQDNINKYFNSDQKNTFLDVPYEAFDDLNIPSILQETQAFSATTNLPQVEIPTLELDKKTLIYNYYNLDPDWYGNDDMQRILLLEPSFFEQYPVSNQCIDFVLDLSKNIKDIKIMVGAFSELANKIPKDLIYYKEHPTNAHYNGHEEPRDWMFDIKGYYPSFFGFWKKCKKELKNQ